MNIFVLDENPELAAKYHCDKHVVKMILETTQLLVSTYYSLKNIYTNKNITNEQLKKIFPNFPLQDENWEIKYYKLTHINHPCTKWTRESFSNFNWLLNLWIYLCKEYTDRYNKTHKLEKVLKWMKDNKPKWFKDFWLTEFAKAMPEEYKVEFNSVQSYRNYYLWAKYKFAKWSYSEKPYWWNI